MWRCDSRDLGQACLVPRHISDPLQVRGAFPLDRQGQTAKREASCQLRSCQLRHTGQGHVSAKHQQIIMPMRTAALEISTSLALSPLSLSGPHTLKWQPA